MRKMSERLDKIVAQGALLTRTEAQSAIRRGRVLCGGRVCTDPAEKFDRAACEILLDGKKLRADGFIYIMMNKPAGVLSATEDKDSPTALDLLAPEYKKRRLGVVGRLDKDASGFLLLTDDGALNHMLTSPKSHAPKLYEAILDAEPDPSAVDAFAKGMDLGDFTAMPAKLEIRGKTCLVTVREGKFHQVKRMFEKVGRRVLALKRLKIGELSLDENLAPGAYRELLPGEIALLKVRFR